MGGQPTSQRKKAKHTRSRLGCGVCRTRRVRCDQTRPVCNRCSSTKRKCDGYTEAPKALASSLHQLTLLPKGPASAVQIEFKESYALRHFLHSTSKELAGDFEDDFWRCLVLQACIKQSCVRHMAVALACLHGCLEPQTDMVPIAGQLKSQALSYYGMAIRRLNSLIDRSGWSQIESILMCSILCILFEWRQQNYASALTHLRSSLHVLQQWFFHANDTSHGSSRKMVKVDDQFIRRTLLPALAKLEVQSVSLLGGYTSSISNLVGELRPDLEFNTLPEAKESLFRIIAQVYLRAPNVTPADLSLFRAQQAQWSERLDIVLSRQPLNTDAYLKGKAAVQAITLCIWRRTTYLMALKESMKEFQFDWLSGEFWGIFELCERLVGMQQSSTFTADLSVVLVLYFVAFHAPDFTLRQKAIILLEASRRYEGIWNSGLATLVAKKAYGAAEQGLLDIDEAITQSFWDLEIIDGPD
ncbi:Zn2 Cys6 DNA-binding protein [Fusarium tjaetaba]|uniref:Zn2 Cys6 DNA-binding protein n=1 Tax=Fusarium tjaetaba TaxID=1567544 RepID=A0A8H5SDN1_9HYPO|nr:Zn2 Cys6 DNA-binding protein [Fusarium tjaetaba]KAF5649079.1 Zn2 Cys6 DNA-binding protein [Fusarium tjaetaba]